MKIIIATFALTMAVATHGQADDAATAQQAALEAAAAAIEDAADEHAEAAGVQFDPSRDANADVDAALAAARTSGRHVMIVYGGDWCHDSDALVDALSTPRAQQMLASRYEMAWVHVPFSPDQRSIPAATRFGLGDVEGTPTVLIVSADGTPINLSDAPRWRNAASRKPAAIVRHFERAVTPVIHTIRP